MQLNRPFSTSIQSGLKFQPTKNILSKAGLEHMSAVSLAEQRPITVVKQETDNQEES